MKLSNLLLKIQTEDKFKKSLMKAPDGDTFEKNILNELTRESAQIAISPIELSRNENFKAFKEKITSMDDDSTEIKNEYFEHLTNNRTVIIFQPFGSQSYPDFLLMNNNYVLPLEIKFSTRSGTKPTWNSGLPRTPGIYIFGSYMNEDCTFFSGGVAIPSSERIALVRAFDKADEYLKSIIDNEEPSTDFSVYLRRMYNQKNDVLKSTNRVEKEKQTILHLLKLGF